MRGLIDTVDTLITAPTLEPLDLDEVKKLLKFTATSEDTLIDLWISAARQYFEAQTGRQILTATWELWLDGFPEGDQIELPHAPLQSVTSVKYDDTDEVEQTYSSSNYRVLAHAGPYASRGRIALNVGSVWPSTAIRAKAVRIRYVAGYGNAVGDVPELIRSALYFLVGHFHRYRAEGQDTAISLLPLGAKAMIAGFRDTAISTLSHREQA